MYFKRYKHIFKNPPVFHFINEKLRGINKALSLKVTNSGYGLAALRNESL